MTSSFEAATLASYVIFFFFFSFWAFNFIWGPPFFKPFEILFSRFWILAWHEWQRKRWLAMWQLAGTELQKSCWIGCIITKLVQYLIHLTIKDSLLLCVYQVEDSQVLRVSMREAYESHKAIANCNSSFFCALEKKQ